MHSILSPNTSKQLPFSFLARDNKVQGSAFLFSRLLSSAHSSSHILESPQFLTSNRARKSTFSAVAIAIVLSVFSFFPFYIRAFEINLPVSSPQTLSDAAVISYFLFLSSYLSSAFLCVFTAGMSFIHLRYLFYRI